MGRVIRTRNLGRLGVLFFLGAGLAVGCAGKSESSDGSSDDDNGGTSGAAGSATGGSADGGTGGANGGTGAISKGGCGPTGGSSAKGGGCAVGGASGTGTGGLAGSVTAGVGGTQSTGGATPTGGVAGEGGAAGTSGEECRSDEDCVMVSDCCSCRAEPRSGGDNCALDCVRDPCADDGIEPNEVSCVRGRCMIARSCDRTRVTCRSAPPDCAEGYVPSVDGTCWGPCISATECSYVTNCDDCPRDAVCVEFQAQLSSFSCVFPASGCSAGNYCSCLGACDYCSEVPEGVTCACPTC